MIIMQSILEEGIQIEMEKGLEKGMEISTKQEAERKLTQFVTSLLKKFPTWTDKNIAGLAGAGRRGRAG